MWKSSKADTTTPQSMPKPASEGNPRELLIEANHWLPEYLQLRKAFRETYPEESERIISVLKGLLLLDHRKTGSSPDPTIAIWTMNIVCKAINSRNLMAITPTQILGKCEDILDMAKPDGILSVHYKPYQKHRYLILPIVFKDHWTVLAIDTILCRAVTYDSEEYERYRPHILAALNARAPPRPWSIIEIPSHTSIKGPLFALQCILRIFCSLTRQTPSLNHGMSSTFLRSQATKFVLEHCPSYKELFEHIRTRFEVHYQADFSPGARAYLQNQQLVEKYFHDSTPDVFDPDDQERLMDLEKAAISGGAISETLYERHVKQRKAPRPQPGDPKSRPAETSGFLPSNFKDNSASADTFPTTEHNRSRMNGVSEPKEKRPIESRPVPHPVNASPEEASALNAAIPFGTNTGPVVYDRGTLKKAFFEKHKGRTNI